VHGANSATLHQQFHGCTKSFGVFLLRPRTLDCIHCTRLYVYDVRARLYDEYSYEGFTLMNTAVHRCTEVQGPLVAS
jgi:hypothetical protein